MGGPRLTWDGYATQWASTHGGFDPRRGSSAVRVWLQMGYGLSRVFATIHVRPTALTVVGLLLNLAVPVTAVRGAGWPITSAVLVVLAAMADTVDGGVALLADRRTKLGYVYDAIADRFAELAWLTAFWLLGAPMWLAALCLSVAWLHEYIRAQMVAIGLTEIGSVTVGEWVGRVAVTVAGLVLAGVIGMIDAGIAAGTITIAAVIWLFLGVFGLVQLLSGIRKSVR